MSQIIKKFIGNDQVGANQIRLENNSALKARNQANSADVSIIKLNTSNIAELAVNLNGGGFIASNILVEFDNLAADPGSPTAGLVYYNTTSNVLRFYDGTAWANISAGGGGANTALSNLASVAINTSLISDTDLTDNLGSNTLRWNELFVGAINDSSNVGVLSVDNRVLRDSAGSVSIDFSSVGEVTISKNIVPDSDITKDLGAAAQRYSSVYATTLNNTASNINLVAQNVDLSGSGAAGSIRLFENTDSFYVQLTVDNALAASYTLTLPLNDGASGEVLSTDGSGVLSWVANGTSVSYAKQTYVLNGTDITNQYVTLSNAAIANTASVLVKGAGGILEGASYDYEVTTGGTRIEFRNDLATGGGSALIAGDVLQVSYAY